MSSCSNLLDHYQLNLRGGNFVYQQPVRLNMTIPLGFPVARQFVRQVLIINRLAQC